MVTRLLTVILLVVGALTAVLAVAALIQDRSDGISYLGISLGAFALTFAINAHRRLDQLND
jgi:hypothetical protein